MRFIVADSPARAYVLTDGKLGDIAPTILEVIGIDQPMEMTRPKPDSEKIKGKQTNIADFASVDNIKAVNTKLEDI